MNFVRNSRHRGFALLEALVAIAIIGVTLLLLLQIRNNAVRQYLELGDQHTASWLAEMLMAELISEDLPDPSDEGEDTWYKSGNGDFSRFNDRLNQLNFGRNENWVERETFSKFEFEWTKELIFVGKDFIGNREDMDAWEQPEDERGDAIIEIKDPHSTPAVRLVRVTLRVFLPVKRVLNSEGEHESDAELEKRRSISLVTYVDPNILHKAELEDVDGTTTTNTNTNTNTNNNGGR